MKKPIDLKLTPEGYQKLLDEQKELSLKRPGTLKRMVEAREQGDLSENAGYHAAKEQLGYIDSRIRQLKLMLRFAQVVGGDLSNSVSFGKTVEIEGDGNKQEYTIVSDIEADPLNGKMSDKSPIGKALLGKKVGDSVEIDVPNGKITFKVLAIK